MSTLARPPHRFGTFAAADGRRLAFADEGEGPAVLCLAGLTRNMHDFDHVAAHLAERYRVIRLDSRGRGRSEHAQDPIAEYSVPVEAGDVLALIAHLGLHRVSIIGTSRGGILGMALAAGNPGLVDALVLNDIGAMIEMKGLLRILAGLGRAPEDASFEAAAERLAAEHAADFPGVPVARWLVHARAVYRDEAGRPALSYDPHLRAAAAAAMDLETGFVDLWPLFRAIGEVPVLLIRGANSDLLSAKTAEAMAAENPRLSAVTVADRAHVPFLDEPPAVAAIDAFLAEHAA
ncbi:MAG: alpha/beta hydrolase [Pseudomonadota bacterium]